MTKIYTYSTCRILAAMSLAALMSACADSESPDSPEVPDGMVEIRPTLSGVFSTIQRVPSDAQQPESRTYDDNEATDGKLNNTHRLPIGSTVWLIADNTTDNGQPLAKQAYVVYNPEDDQTMSYLVPCTVDDDGNMLTMEGKPFYLKDNQTYMFYAVSPARKLDEQKFAQGQVAFQVKNGEAFYANDCRYTSTTPHEVKVTGSNPESVQVVTLSPMINQTALLKIQIGKGANVHDLDVQPSGIMISGLQNDHPDDGVYGDSNGLFWHMSLNKDDEPIILQHGTKTGSMYSYDYTIDEQGRINVEVPILPMRSMSKPVIVALRIKINGVPTTVEMMLNEKDFKAGYSYGYRGVVTTEDGVTVEEWQYVAWEIDQDFPFE